MSDGIVAAGDPRFEQLYSIWVKEQRPGYITVENGGMYRILQPSDGVVKFEPVKGSIDGLYSSSSTSKLTGGR